MVNVENARSTGVILEILRRHPKPLPLFPEWTIVGIWLCAAWLAAGLAWLGEALLP